MATAEALLTAEGFGRRPDPGYPAEPSREGSAQCRHRLHATDGSRASR
jgi:hypothetical protein